MSIWNSKVPIKCRVQYTKSMRDNVDFLLRPLYPALSPRGVGRSSSLRLQRWQGPEHSLQTPSSIRHTSNNARKRLGIQDFAKFSNTSQRCALCAPSAFGSVRPRRRGGRRSRLRRSARTPRRWRRTSRARRPPRARSSGEALCRRRGARNP